mmetsp:Transcript_42219/g.103116  ORF Transcript_42219/g.103116 Transcript_42219/m.103116 type:complete len:121 (-) Transcript_42219:3300-3662(-)
MSRKQAFAKKLSRGDNMGSEDEEEPQMDTLRRNQKLALKIMGQDETLLQSVSPDSSPLSAVQPSPQHSLYTLSDRLVSCPVQRPPAQPANQVLVWHCSNAPLSALHLDRSTVKPMPTTHR